MNRMARILIFIVIVLGLTSCGVIDRTTSSSEVRPEQSTFKQNFSIGIIVEGHEELLIEAPRTLSGMEAGPREPFIQSQEYITMQVEQENIAALMKIIQFDIQNAIIDSGAEHVGSGGSSQFDEIANFSFSYHEGPIYGVINIWAFRGKGTNFAVIAQITEDLD